MKVTNIKKKFPYQGTAGERRRITETIFRDIHSVCFPFLGVHDFNRLLCVVLESDGLQKNLCSAIRDVLFNDAALIYPGPYADV